MDYDQRSDTTAIFRILGDGKYWSEDTDSEKGNFDYLMNADIDVAHPDVQQELMDVAYFMINSLGYEGFRYDALKHIDTGFIDRLSAFKMCIRDREKRRDYNVISQRWSRNTKLRKMKKRLVLLQERCGLTGKGGCFAISRLL